MRDSTVISRSDALPKPLGQKEIGSGVLHQIALGDLTAAQKCISSYGDMVWSICKASTDSTESAEDATCDIFKEIWRCAKNFDRSGLEEKIFIALLARRYLERAGFHIPD